MDKDQIAKLLCYFVGFLVAVYILASLFPYLVLFLAAVGVWHLFQQYDQDQGKKR